MQDGEKEEKEENLTVTDSKSNAMFVETTPDTELMRNPGLFTRLYDTTPNRPKSASLAEAVHT